MKIQLSLHYIITGILTGLVAGAIICGLTYLLLDYTTYNLYVNVALVTIFAAIIALVGSMVPLEGADFGSVLGVGIGGTLCLMKGSSYLQITGIGIIISLGALLAVILYEKCVNRN